MQIATKTLQNGTRLNTRDADLMSKAKNEYENVRK